MRHTFLPIEDQRILKKEYRIRVIIVALTALIVVGLIGVITQVPAYLQVVAERAGHKVAQDPNRDGDAAARAAEIRKELVADMAMLRSLDADVRELPSVIIRDTISARGSVRIYTIEVASIATSSATVIIQGVAPTRDALVSFRSRLETMAVEGKVDLPLSELARSRDIPFSLTYSYQIP